MCLLLAANVATAEADTDVSGDRDANAPLVIDPSTNPTDALTTVSSSNSELVMFVQRMPVTKVVDEVTVGDLAVGPGCSTGTVNAKIEEYVNRELGGAGGVFFALASKSITATPSKISWDFSPVAFRKDRGYAIRVSISGCSKFSQTTWAHNEPQVNPGQLRCAKGPQGWRRMWHEAGTDDRLAGCVDRPPGQGSFDPSMPTGWLISQIAQNGSGLWDVRKFSTASAPVCNTPNPPNTYEQYGGAPIFWRSSPAFPFNPEYTCRWTQWADFGERPQDGWYYAQPWIAQKSGAPRDMYLKLDTIDYDALLAAHVPVLKYDSGENFHVLSPGAMSDFYVDNGDPADSNSLSDGSGTFAFSNFLLGGDGANDPAALTLDYLQPAYPAEAPGLPAKRRSGSASETSDVLGARGDADDGFYTGDAAIMESNPAYSYKVYGRVAHGSDDSVWPGGKLWLQYWFFFYFNDVEVVGEHEGDWEMIQVGLNASNAPDVVGYAQHNAGQRCGWASIERSGLRPVVYTAEGTHASYFGPDRIPLQYLFDHADGLGGALLSPNLHQIATDSPTWVGWRGAWGDSGSSPQGPQFQGAKWSDPNDWADGLDEC